MYLYPYAHCSKTKPDLTMQSVAFERGEQVLFESFFKIFFTQFLPPLLNTFFQKHTFVENLHSHLNAICRQTV